MAFPSQPARLIHTSARPRRLVLLLSLAAAVALAATVLAVTLGPTHEPRETGPLANLSPRSLERPIALAAGIGNVHQPVTSKLAGARRYYDQGLAYLASFDWVRAARSFHQARREDPQLAAALLGLGRAYLGLESAELARLHVRQADELAEDLGLRGREKEWIELGVMQMEAVIAERTGVAGRHRELLQAIESYLSRYPDDVHAWVLRGNIDPRPDGWGQAGGEGSLSWYSKALELAPEHFPAEHFLAHSLENLGRYREARDHAKRYSELAPEVPHAHHMVAHVSPRLGEWDEALASLTTADRLHRQSFEEGETEPRQDWHYGHNLRLMAAVLWQLGQHQRAGELYRACFEIRYAGRRAGLYCQPWITVLLLEGRFEESLTAAQSCGRRDSELAGVLAAAMEGEALLGLERGDEARRALAESGRRLRRLMPRLRADSSERTIAFNAQLAVRVLEAKVTLAEDPTRGENLIRAVADGVAGGHSFDAWAAGALRVEELTAHLERRGNQRLATELAEVGRRPMLASLSKGRHCE